MKDKIIISFFFNARGEQLEKSTTGMYRSLLLQMLQQLPGLHNVLEPRQILGIRQNHHWGVEALRTLFEQTVEGLADSSVVAFIDALDECDESEIRSMVSSFKSLGNMSAAEGISFQACFASRHYPHITMPRKIELVLEGQEGHEQDIISYLDSELEIGDSKLANEIRAQITQKASGVFMWVVLVCGILQQKFDEGRIHDLKQTLEDIPGDLNKLFRDILTRDDANKDEMLLCIKWILFARNPLRPEQLYFAIRSHTECTTSKWDRDEITEATIRNFILSSSKGLAEVIRTRYNPTVQFIHESVKDLLLKKGGFRDILETSGDIVAESHDQLKRCCYQYTRSYADKFGLPESGSGLHRVRDHFAAYFEFPFLDYALQNTLYHANAADEGNISQTEFLKAFHLEKWMYNISVSQDIDICPTTGASLLYVLAEYNFGSLIESYRGSESCFDIEDERYGAPILAAMAMGSRPTVWRLLKRETRDMPTTSRLQCLCNEYEIYKEKKHGIGRNFRFRRKRGLIYYILKDDEPTVATIAIALSKADTQRDFRPPNGETLLSIAMKHSHDISSTFKFLLGNGVDIASKDELGRTPLCLVAARGDTAAVAFLLEKGANVQYADICVQPLMHATDKGNEQCMRLMISSGANVAAADEEGQTALFYATRSRMNPLNKVNLLLDHGADINSADNSGRTPLSRTAVFDAQACELLLDRRADIDRADNNGRTPLSHAAGCHPRAIKLLLDRGADVNAADNRGMTPLVYAVQSSTFFGRGCVQLLLDGGAIPDTVDEAGKTALSYATDKDIQDLLSNYV
ncbi:hypothetical protein FPRO05_02881 [Fusarium proliferatum]|uniref:Nephrocystin 3-like N-terminal domain-containing protein n=1 Tax=Gibberella intermedia TaxID=948311 RepID=A0A365MZW0_GIBIN|nr:hypothetical protein FPRO05_02881 [Fusarium proliferatum]